jgi:hypothetical protein
MIRPAPYTVGLCVPELGYTYRLFLFPFNDGMNPYASEIQFYGVTCTSILRGRDLGF